MKKPRITTPKLDNPNARKKPMVFKVNEEEEELILSRASKLAGGNLSAYLRHAALNYTEGK